MKIDNLTRNQQLFICTNTRAESACCQNKNSLELANELKSYFKTNHPGKVQIVKSGCLGPCSEGIAAMLYPEGLLLKAIELNDRDKIIELIESKLI